MSPASRARKWFVLTGLLFAFPALVWSQTNGLQGTDLTVSGALPGDQTFPSAAFGLNGGFVVWQDAATDPSGLGVSARRLDAGLNPVGPPFRVNQTVIDDQQRAKVSMLNDGGAVVVLQNGHSGKQNVLARFLNASGGFTTSEILVNDAVFKGVNRYVASWTLIHNNKSHVHPQHISEKISIRHDFNANPVVATLSDGSVVVAYSSSRVYITNTVGLVTETRYDKHYSPITNTKRVKLSFRTETMQDVYVQRLSATGQKLGGEFRANQFTEFNQRDVSLSALENGNFVAVWVSEQQRTNAPADIFARVFDTLGNPLGNEFCVSVAATRTCSAPTVAGTTGGGFTIAWTQRSEDRSRGMDIYARTFDASGNGTSDAFVVNTFTYGDQFAPSIASLGSQQVIVWSSMGQDGSWEGVFGQAFNGATTLGDEFRVNVFTPFKQIQPQIASDHAGRALVLWSGYAVDSGFDLFGRSYLAP